jgi:hypothetical protein
MTAFFGILGLVVIAGAVVYFYKHPSKPGAKPTEGIDYDSMSKSHDKKK